VNVAARLQQLCKEQGRDVLVSETTYDLARSGGLRVDVAMHEVVSLRGRDEPVRVFALG
jgi:class 3 adenylate cyclase